MTGLTDELDPQGSAAADAPPADQPDPPTHASDAAADADEEAAWAAVIADAEGEDPPPAGDEPAGGTGREADPSHDEAPPDIWADAPDELRSAFDAERQRADQAEHARRSAEGRLNTAMHRLSRVTGTRERPRSGSPSDPADTDTPDASAALAQLAEDYPEIAGPVSKVIEDLRSEVRTLRAQTDSLGQRHAAEVYGENERALEERHPDFENIGATPEFADWIAGQSGLVQAVYLENVEQIVSVDDVAYLLDKYKADKGIANDGDGQQPRRPADSLREIRLQGNRGNPRPSGGAVTRERGTEEGSEDFWWDRLEKQETKRLAARARA